MPKLKGLVQLSTDIKGRWSIEAPPGAEVFSEEFQPEKLTLEKTLDIQGYSAKLYLKKAMLKFPLAVGEHAVWKIPPTLDSFPRVVSNNQYYYCIRFRPQKDYALIGGYDYSTSEYKLWRINPDGSGFTALTTTPNTPLRIEWLGDGSKALVLIYGNGIYEYNPSNNSLTLKYSANITAAGDIRYCPVDGKYYILWVVGGSLSLVRYNYSNNQVELVGNVYYSWHPATISILTNPFRLCFAIACSTAGSQGIYLYVYDGNSLTPYRFRNFDKYLIEATVCGWDTSGQYLIIMVGVWDRYASQPPYFWTEVWKWTLDGNFTMIHQEIENHTVYIRWGSRFSDEDKFIVVGGGHGIPYSEWARYSVYWDGHFVTYADGESFDCLECDTV
jgi:hypothetical protein